MKNTQEFLDRFNRWKNGAPIQELYKAGRPVKFDEGKDINEGPKEDPALRASLEYALALKLDKYNEGKDTEEPKAVAGGYNFNAIHKVAQNAPLSYGSYYDLTGDVNMDNMLPKYNTGKAPSKSELFVAKMSPVLYQEILNAGIKNPDKVHEYMMRQLGYESAHGTSRIARKQHNYGGVGWNGKTYYSYDTEKAFAKDYVSLMKRRYKDALAANTIQDYALALKKRGYYEDSLDNYTRNLVNMNSISNAVRNHKKSNPDLYVPQSVAKPKPITTPVTESLQQSTDQFVPQPVYRENSVVWPQQMAYDPSVPEYINKDAGVATWPRTTVLPNIIDMYNSVIENNTLPLQPPLRQWITR